MKMPALPGPVLVAFAASLWGLWSLFFKSAERSAGATTVSAQAEAFVIMSVMLVALVPKALLDARRAPWRPNSDWLRIALVGAIDGGNALFFLLAMQKTTVAIAVLTHDLAPLFVALAAPVALKERWHARTFVALGLAFAGLALLLRPWSSSSPGDVYGALLGALSAVFYAANVLLQKSLASRFSPYELGAFTKPTALLLLFAALPSAGALVLPPAPAAILVAGGVVCGAVPLVIFFAGLARTRASQAAVLTLCEPLVAVLVGVFVWGEPLGALGIAGAGLILVGAGLAARTGAEPSPSLLPAAPSE